MAALPGARLPHTLSPKRHIDILQHLHRIGPATLFLRVKDHKALLRDLAVDDVEEDRAEGVLHVGADPDEEPVVELSAGGEDSADAGAGADGDTAAVEVAEVGETGKLRIYTKQEC